jgi:hypothetical protein
MPLGIGRHDFTSGDTDSHGSSFSNAVGIVRCIEKLLIACASMSLDSCYSAG